MIINHGELMQDVKWRKKAYFECVKFLFAENIVATKFQNYLKKKKSFRIITCEITMVFLWALPRKKLIGK